MSRLFPALGSLGLLFLITGCGETLHPVQGRVLFEDDTPMTGGWVVMETADGKSSAQGDIQPNGEYRLGTRKPGDGVRPGKYRVLISTPPLKDGEDPAKRPPGLRLDPRFQDFDTSKLEIVVPSPKGEYPLKVARLKKSGG